MLVSKSTELAVILILFLIIFCMFRFHEFSFLLQGGEHQILMTVTNHILGCGNFDFFSEM